MNSKDPKTLARVSRLTKLEIYKLFKIYANIYLLFYINMSSIEPTKIEDKVVFCHHDDSMLTLIFFHCSLSSNMLTCTKT